MYEVMVEGEDSLGALSEISRVVSEARANFMFAHGQMDAARKKFSYAYFCEFAGATVTPDELSTRLRGLSFVTDVRLASMKGMMFEKFMFPLRSASDRILHLRADAFVEMENRLVEIFGAAGETMSYEQGKAYAQSVMKGLEDYRQEIGAAWDICNIQDLFRAEGWGVAEVTEVPDGYEVSVKSAPSHARAGAAKGPGKFVVGLLVGMLRMHSKGHLAAGQPAYDAMTDEYRFSIKKVKRA